MYPTLPPHSTPSAFTDACPRWLDALRRSWRLGFCATRADACSTTTTATVSAAAAPGAAVAAAATEPPHRSPPAATGFPTLEGLACPRGRWRAALGLEEAGAGDGNLETGCRELTRPFSVQPAIVQILVLIALSFILRR